MPADVPSYFAREHENALDGITQHNPARQAAFYIVFPHSSSSGTSTARLVTN